MSWESKLRYASALLFIAVTAATGTHAQSNASKTDLTGKWTSSCHKGARGIYMIEAYTFHKDQTFQREQKRFKDEDCAVDALTELKDFEGAYAIVGTAKRVAPDAHKIDFTIRHVFETALADAAAKKLNDSRFCNVIDWKRGERRDITGLLCNDQIIPPGTVIYDIVENTGDKLYFGDNSFFYTDVDNRKLRPTRLDKSLPFVKTSALSE